uniref:hypothetical protein n=1 Tax=Escherichia coli TaxID=562 RepID=UPI0032AF91B7
MSAKIKYALSAAVLALIAAGASAPQILDQFLDEKEGTGVGSCRTLQMKAHYRNGGLFYRSSRDGYGFEED